MAYQVKMKCIATGSRLENGRLAFEADFQIDQGFGDMPRGDISLTVLAPLPFTPGATYSVAFIPEES